MKNKEKLNGSLPLISQYIPAMENYQHIHQFHSGNGIDIKEKNTYTYNSKSHSSASTSLPTRKNLLHTNKNLRPFFKVKIIEPLR